MTRLQSLIKLENVTKVYQLGNTNFHALKGVDLSLMRGEMVAIIGSSGSGKSTLMNIIGFLDHCTSGTYFFNQQDVSHLKEDTLAKIRNTKIGFIFQSFFLLPRFTAWQNAMLPLFYQGMQRQKAKEIAHHMLDKVGMAPFADHRPNQLSGGQQQRVAIARALIANPDLILADEPTGALDSATGNEVMELLLDLNREEDRTIIIVTHDQEISRRCQRIVKIKDGRVL